MRGIIGAAGLVPHYRLQRSEITAFHGSGGGKGSRAVASHDQDTTTLGAEAAAAVLRSVGAVPNKIWLSTATPAYLDKSNASAIHAALQLPADVAAFDFGGGLRSAVGALLTAAASTESVLVIGADLRDGLPTSADESAGGDAGVAILVDHDSPASPVLAEVLGSASATDEFMDRWRAPGARNPRVWEERFGESHYIDLGRDAFDRAMKSAGIAASDVHRVAVTGMHPRAVKAIAAKLGCPEGALVDDLSVTVGQTGCAHPLLLLTSMLEQSIADGEGRALVLLHLADGADALVVRTTPALAGWHPFRTIAEQVTTAASLPYAKFLSWRDVLAIEPPRRPEPARVSSSAAWRSRDWKYGFVGSKDRDTGAVHLPPARVSMEGGAFDEMEPVSMSAVVGTVVTLTVDRMAYSPSPPIVFAVVDFDGGGRFPVELTDVAADEVAVGDRVEMTFRRLFTADGIHDYFWKARPVPTDIGAGSADT